MRRVSCRFCPVVDACPFFEAIFCFWDDSRVAQLPYHFFKNIFCSFIMKFTLCIWYLLATKQLEKVFLKVNIISCATYKFKVFIKRICTCICTCYLPSSTCFWKLCWLTTSLIQLSTSRKKGIKERCGEYMWPRSRYCKYLGMSDLSFTLMACRMFISCEIISLLSLHCFIYFDAYQTALLHQNGSIRHPRR